METNNLYHKYNNNNNIKNINNQNNNKYNNYNDFNIDFKNFSSQIFLTLILCIVLLSHAHNNLCRWHV